MILVKIHLLSFGIWDAPKVFESDESTSTIKK